MDTQTLPAWMAPVSQSEACLSDPQSNLPYYHPQVVKQQMSLAATKRAIEEHMFETLFEPVLDKLAENESLEFMFNADPRKPNLGRFIRWVYRDPERQHRYREAQKVTAELIFQQIIPIADAVNSIEDESRTKARTDARWRTIAVMDRDRFGDVKKIEQAISIDIGNAMQRAQERLDRMRTVDAPLGMIENDG